MNYEFNHLDIFNAPSIDYISEILRSKSCHLALIKKIPPNANDKNQVYFHSDFSLLNAYFDLNISERGLSKSTTKRSSKPGKAIPQAAFNQFYWCDNRQNLHQAKNCKAIVYAQYPESRLSGFLTQSNEMPRTMSIDYVKRPDRLDRYLVLGARTDGAAVALMLVAPSGTFVSEFKALDYSLNSTICKVVHFSDISQTNSAKLEAILRHKVAGKTLTGCRYDKSGTTIPFTGTQVHGYTLEHACGITPNSDKNGDIFGIELKCFTRKKLTLFTPEPDGGLYNESFKDFMTKYGYLKDNCYRFTGLHRANIQNCKTGLTLKIYWWDRINKDEFIKKAYDPEILLAKQMRELDVVLEDDMGNIAASWSLERLMGCWGAKHNEVVYVPAFKTDNSNVTELEKGYKFQISFSENVLWCRNTTAERLLQAIDSGLVYLDPAPKYSKDDPSLNKRRSQWRVNDIYKAAPYLYDENDQKSLV